MQKVKFSQPDPSGFYKVVSARVDDYFLTHHISRKANLLFTLKALFFLLLTAVTYATILSAGSQQHYLPLLFILLGLFNTILVFTVAHDAAHHAISEKKSVNRLLEYVWDTAGISSYFWKLKHNISHHSFTNVPGRDGDIDQSKLLLLNPCAPRKWFHRYQHIYAPFLYALLSLHIIYVKDFKLLFTHAYGNKTIRKHPKKEHVILFAGKLFFISYMILIPKIVLHLSWMQIIGYHLLMHLAIGLFIGLVLVPVHVTEAAAYRVPDSKGAIGCDWGEHQLEATVDFSADNSFVGFVTGGLNTHVAHHLFPSINHIHYRRITGIIRDTAAEMHLPYRNYSWYSVILNHLRFLKLLGSDNVPSVLPAMG